VGCLFAQVYGSGSEGRHSRGKSRRVSLGSGADELPETPFSRIEIITHEKPTSRYQSGVGECIGDDALIEDRCKISGVTSAP
jgi:hypothetical protein